MTSTEIYVRPSDEAGIDYVDATGLPADVIQGPVQHVARELARWVDTTRGGQRKPSLFNRAAYISPDSPYAQMAIAKAAVENDDIIGGVADITEGLMLQGVQWESPDSDITDVFNQNARDLNLDEFVRMWHRDWFTYSQAIMGTWWGRKSFTVRGHNGGLTAEQQKEKDEKEEFEHATAVATAQQTGTVAPLAPVKKAKRRYSRKKTYDLMVPVRIMLLDPMRVVPMPPTIFGHDRLAWHASEHEYDAYDSVLRGEASDPVMEYFFNGPVEGLSRAQRDELISWGIDPSKLVWLDPKSVVRHTRTKASYERFVTNRLKSTFPLLDLKQQAMEADRVALVGAVNYILLVKKGSDAQPATPEEIRNLKEGMVTLAKLPVVVGDHRLEIEIITPDMTNVLSSDRYDTLDHRILNRTMGMFDAPGSGGKEGTTTMLSRAVSRQLEGSRLMLRRVLEDRISRAVTEHPANKEKVDNEPNLAYTPRNVQLDADSQTVQALLALRTQKEISRYTILEWFGLDQEVEADRREQEALRFDDIFETQVPFSAAGPGGAPGAPVGPKIPVAPQVSGGAGGRPAGGGKTANSPAKKTAPKTAKGNPSTGSK